MAGIGEASAIASFVTIGFSLTKSLTAVIGDIRGAGDDVSGLATEIDAVLRQVEELDVLLVDNMQSKVLSDNGVLLAKKGRDDSESIVNKLVNLLKKSGSAAPATGTVGRQEIDFSLIRRINWARLKPRLELTRRELEQVRISMLLVKTLYTAKGGYVKLRSLLAHRGEILTEPSKVFGARAEGSQRSYRRSSQKQRCSQP